MLPECSHKTCEKRNPETGRCIQCENPVNVVLMWHMHQPQYENLKDRSFVLPWTYLHCIKDYSDMAEAIHTSPGARAVVNFSATLLDQIVEYGRQLAAYFEEGTPLGDELLGALSKPLLTTDPAFRKRILQQCLRAHKKNLILRYPHFAEMADIAAQAIKSEAKAAYLKEQFFFDLLVWYHLAWMGETIKRSNSDCQYLIAKQKNYTADDRQTLLQLIAEVINDIIPSYRRLWEEGRIELTFTPENHPIIPLLLDFSKARESIPDAPLPGGSYPGGRVRSEAQISKGIEIFEEHFGHKPVGCWPAEGALCEQTLELLRDQDIRWAASGAGVLHNSLNASKEPEGCIHHSYQFGERDIRCFFRDDNLSDLIGFTFHDWNPEDAVNHMIHHIENIQSACNFQPDTIVPIILDGENCWEYYPGNGYAFLQALYKKLGNHHRIKLTTFGEYLDQEHKPHLLSTLVAGSWVNGNLATWIGDKDKNLGWELLVRAKQAYDQVLGTLPVEQQLVAEKQLSICESSDWFWWFGDYNAADSVSDFDRLYREHLKNLYHSLGLHTPDTLETEISVGHGNPEMDGTMRRGGA